MAARTHSGRTRKTKAEVQEEFETIKEAREAEKLESSPKAEEQSRQREDEVRQAVRELTSESLAQRISGLGIEVSKTLAELSMKLTGEYDLLASLREAVSLEKKELDRLHKIDVGAVSLDQMIENYAQQKAALEAGIASTRGEWEAEAERRKAEQREFDETLKTQRIREKEDYEYKKNLERKKEADAYEESVRLQERKNKEKQELLEKSWQAREAALKQREEEVEGLKKEVAAFPDRLRQEVEESTAEALKAIKTQHQQELLVLQKDAEAEKRLSELKIKSLEETLARQFSQIESLGSRLEEAKKQVQDIAVKAIEGASGAKALSHVNQIAMEQAKVRGPQP